MIMKAKKTVTLKFQYLSNPSSNLFETLEYAYFILNKHIGLKWKKHLNFGPFDL